MSEWVRPSYRIVSYRIAATRTPNLRDPRDDDFRIHLHVQHELGRHDSNGLGISASVRRGRGCVRLVVAVVQHFARRLVDQPQRLLVFVVQGNLQALGQVPQRLACMWERRERQRQRQTDRERDTPAELTAAHCIALRKHMRQCYTCVRIEEVLVSFLAAAFEPTLQHQHARRE